MPNENCLSSKFFIYAVKDGLKIKTIGKTKNKISLRRPFNVAEKFVVHNSDKTITEYNNIGRSKENLKRYFILFVVKTKCKIKNASAMLLYKCLNGIAIKTNEISVAETKS
jgi:hypothetical protein